MADTKDKGEAGETPKKKEVLDLLDESGDKKVAARKAVAEKKAAAEAAAKVEAERLATLKAAAIEKAKPEALDLLEKPKKAKKTTKKKADNAELPPISIIQAEKEAAFQAALHGADETRDPAEEDSESKDEEVQEDESESESEDPTVIHLKSPIMIESLAERMGLKPFKLIADLIEFGVFANAKGSIEPDIAAQVCEKHGFTFEKEQRAKGAGVHKVDEVIEVPPIPEEEPEAASEGDGDDTPAKDESITRPPIITFMGHVDHGKTSLLDAIRKSKVTDGEAGGITQHIGAYTIEHEGQQITFLDTPGHAAFTRMRARGAEVTDIVILVVAADDGLMPQTREAISHAQAAKSSIIVAINKIDRPGADTNRVKTQLQEAGLTTTDWGGEIESVDVSATEGTGVEQLIETMLLQAEVLELKANPKLPARATVIEASVQAGKGPTATVIVNSGTLKLGKPFICGLHDGKVKSLLNDLGEQVKEAGPSIAVELIGFNELPCVGDQFIEMNSAREAKKLSAQRIEEVRKEKLTRGVNNHGGTNVADFIKSLDSDGPKTLNLLLKTDVAGTAEAIKEELLSIESDKVDLNFLHAGAGAISESDIILAKASGAVILGFNVKLESKAVKVARREGVEIRPYSIIYELIDQIRDTMLGLLDAETREKTLGSAEVKQIFKLARRGRVAGCVVNDGKIVQTARARIIRGRQAVFDGGFSTLRRFTEEVTEVKAGLECGIRVGDYTEYEVGDVIQCYELEKLEIKL